MGVPFGNNDTGMINSRSKQPGISDETKQTEARNERVLKQVFSVDISPDGRYLLSSSRDGTMLWELDWEWEFPEDNDSRR